jgi:hypothetical protein
MATGKRFLSLPVLNKLDNWLLLNKPETWSARTHLVIYYGGLFMLALAAICFVFPDDARSASGAANWALFTSIITLLATVLWVIYLLRFNVFKRFGNTSATNRLVTFVMYFIAAGIITLISFVEPAVETVKANMAYGDEELVNDINSINLKITQLEYDSLDNVWGRDTFHIVNEIPGRARETNDGDMAETTTDTAIPVLVDGHKRPLRLLDTAELRMKLRTADSTEKINDSVYVFLSCPDYTWIHEFGADRYTDAQVMSDRNIYDSIVMNYQKPHAGIQRELAALIDKYYYEHYNPYYYTDTPVTGYVNSIPVKYSTDKVSRSFSHIVDRKYRWCGTSGQILFRVFFYITLCVTLLVFIFRHTTVRTFFYTLLAGTIITILTALIMAFTRWYEHGSFFFMLLLFYFVAFAAVTATAWTTATRKVITGIAINFFVLMAAFVPLLVTALHDAWEDEKYRGVPSPHPAPEYWNLAYAEVIGVVLLLVLLPTYIHRLYRRWYALPEN